MTFKEITTIHCNEYLVKYAQNREVANAPLLSHDAHGGCPQPRGSGDAIVSEWARRNLVTLVSQHCCPPVKALGGGQSLPVLPMIYATGWEYCRKLFVRDKTLKWM